MAKPVKTIPATCVAMPGKLGAVLLLGRSGAGKSDLALRLIMQHGGKLVADDQLVVSRKGKAVWGSAHPALKGLLEVRGVGIVKLPIKPSAAVSLAVELVPQARDMERLPKKETHDLLGAAIPLIRLYAHEPSATSKLLIALQALASGTMKVGAFKE